jgi:hypothetical protein
MTPPKLIFNESGQPARERRWVKRTIIGSIVAIPFIVVVVLAVLVTTSKPAVLPSSTSLATVKLPFGGATVTRVTAYAGREVKALGVKLVGNQVLPTGKVATGESVTVEVQFKRPGWNGWLAGSSKLLKLTVTTPTAKLTNEFVTVKKGQDMTLHYSAPVAVFGYSTSNGLVQDRTLGQSERSVDLKTTGTAGTLTVSAAPRSWEIPHREAVSWFPGGSHATAVATPAPGTTLKPSSPITLTFSKTVETALSGQMPTVTPTGAGTWKTVNAHTIRYVPDGYGYGLGAKVQISVPAGINLVGSTGDPVASWQVPTGSTARLQQLLADLGYLPVTFTQTGTPVADTLAAQETAAVKAPAGTFAWRYSNTPAALTSQWQPGTYGVVTQGAVMAFETDHDLDPDGVDGPQVWKVLIQAELHHDASTFGYTFVFVHEASSDESETTWHDGKTVASGAVNTGTESAGGTATGTYPVFEHLISTTMSGTNPDGSSYVDPGIPDVSYFHGGDALHGYIRSSYGFPQSDGCVEMPYAEAASVYPYTPVGTLVDVSTS